MHFTLPRRYLILAALMVAVCVLGPAVHAADVVVTVNWGADTGRTATNLHYGLNAYQFSDDEVAGGSSGQANYRTNVGYMKSGFTRMHNMQQMDESTTDRGWIKNAASSTYAWDYAKIDRATYNVGYYGGVKLMNITGWPAYMDDGTGKLKNYTNPATGRHFYDDYAALCADLVQYLNVTKARYYAYWEVPNEKDDVYGSNMTELVKIFNKCAIAMKAKDGSIKVGGPAYKSPYATDGRVENFIAGTKDQIDFVSLHTYSGQGSTATRQSVWNSADGIGWIDGQFRTKINNNAGARASSIAVFHNEYNMARSAFPAWQQDYTSMIYDALAMRSILVNGATGANAWNEGDNWWGKLNNDASWTRRPAAHLFKLMNEDCKGSVRSSTSSNAAQVQVLATIDGSNKRILLINRSEATRTVQITATGWSWAPSSSTTCYMHRVEQVGGYTSQTITTGEVTGTVGWTLPANTVTTLGWWGR